MKERHRWSTLVTTVALFLLACAVAFAQGPTIAIGPGGAGSSPSQTYQPSARIPAVYPSTNPSAPANSRAIFEGPNTTDYFNAQGLFTTPPNPEIAVGPEDILMIVNSQIFRVPNANAAGVPPAGSDVAPSATNPTPMVNPVPFATVGAPGSTQKVFLDNWVGEAALNTLCPTVPRRPFSCLFEHASVRYDQLHGRFLVLFTVTDTGLTEVGQQQGTMVTQTRKSSWVLVVSRLSTLTDTSQPTKSDNLVFATPTIPNTQTGGVAGSKWTIFYGSGTDGFNGAYGNINAPRGTVTPAPYMDCTAGAIAPTTALPTMACYFPTGARLGYDNDTVIITASVYNANINPANLGEAFDPATPVAPGYAGTRVRVIKKAALYRFNTLVPGNQWAGTFNGAAAGDYYDIFTNDGAGNPVGIAAPPTPWTVLASAAEPAAATENLQQPRTRLTPLFCEPQILRGRAMATFSNAHSPAANGTSRSQSYLLCAVNAPYNQLANYEQSLWVLGLLHIVQAAAFPSDAVLGVRPFYPQGQSGVSTAAFAALPFEFATGRTFRNPMDVPQQNYRSGGGAPALYVGDDRPHKLVFREGHLYDARVADISNNGTALFTGGPLAATVMYDVVQKLAAGSVPLNVIQANWQNTLTFAPMYDTPANVSQAGAISPINLLPYLEKLFVSTVYSPLAGQPDPNYAGVTGGDPRSRDDSSTPKSQLPAQANCYSAHTNPSVSSAPLSWASLFDIRCGEDPFDSQYQIRHPVSGALVTKVPFGVYGSGTTDPNDGSLWNFGAYARRRLSTVFGTGQWGTFAANYKLSFPQNDPYGNSYQFYTDVDVNHPFYTYIQMFRNVGVGPSTSTFNPSGNVKRRDMARWLILSQMNEQAITDFLANTPQFGPANVSSFGDVSPTDPDFRYIETMYRRGYTRGCQTTGDVVRRFCPEDNLTRRQMAVFIIRAKLNNVFPSVISGCPVVDNSLSCINVPGGDNFGVFVPTDPYFTDNPLVTGNDDYGYIQKMRELRLTNGVALGTLPGGRNGLYGSEQTLTRGQLAVFLVRAFFL